MAAKMDLILAGPADHVLAAVVRTDTSGPQPTAAGLVGEGLPIRDPETGNAIVTVAPEHLKIQAVDLRDDILMTAPAYVIDNGLPEMGANPAGAPVALSGTAVTVTVPVAAPQSGINVWVYIERVPQPIVQVVRIPSGLVTANEPLQLQSGSYGVVVLAPGVRAVIARIVVP
jgi:hypothetical protein